MDVKKALIIGIVATGVTAGSILTITAIRKRRAKKYEEEQKKLDNAPKTSSTTTTKTNWVAESFPLKKWCKGENVKKLQNALGVTADGYFGSDTESALYKKANVKECSKELFESLVNGKETQTSVGGTTTSGSTIPTSGDAEPTQLMKDYAKKLYKATIEYAWGTDEDAIRDVFYQIKTMNDLNALKDAWLWYMIVARQVKTYKGNLAMLLRDEMSQADIDKYVNTPLLLNGVNYRF